MSALARVSFKKGREHLPRLSKPYVPGRRDKRYWTEDERKVLREHAEEKGAQYCRGLLPHRTTHSIYIEAKKLGLKVKGSAGRGRQEHPISPELDARIREEWATMDARKKGEVARVADVLMVPRWWLSTRAMALGLAIPRVTKEPPWSAAELVLIRKVPLHNPDRCAVIFREHGFLRTPAAIMNKAKRLSISRRYTKTLTAFKCATILGVDSKSFGKWILKGIVQATKREESKRLPQQGGVPWEIERAYFRQWVIDNLEMIDIRKVDKFAFVDLLTNVARQ